MSNQWLIIMDFILKTITEALQHAGDIQN
jgi:hypothetical protein